MNTPVLIHKIIPLTIAPPTCDPVAFPSTVSATVSPMLVIDGIVTNAIPAIPATVSNRNTNPNGFTMKISNNTII